VRCSRSHPRRKARMHRRALRNYSGQPQAIYLRSGCRQLGESATLRFRHATKIGVPAPSVGLCQVQPPGRRRYAAVPGTPNSGDTRIPGTQYPDTEFRGHSTEFLLPNPPPPQSHPPAPAPPPAHAPPPSASACRPSPRRPSRTGFRRQTGITVEQVARRLPRHVQPLGERRGAEPRRPDDLGAPGPRAQPVGATGEHAVGPGAPQSCHES